MAQFPRTEAEIAVLAQEMISGLAANAATYPAPPVNLMELSMMRSAYVMAQNAVIAAQAAADAAYTDKDAALEALAEGMKKDLRYAENTVDFDDDQLKLIGWAGRSASTHLTPPGQTRLLEAVKQGEGWIMLDWKAPADGGKPAAYKVQRRERPSGPGEEAATAVMTEATLVEQPRGLELEYRVIAINKAGEGLESNTIMAVL
jgi:hypothetical protein